jgi:hypothetical protein
MHVLQSIPSAGCLKPTVMYFPAVSDYLANARKESQYFQCPGGLHFPGAIAPFGYENCNWMHMHLQGSFAALPIIWHYQYTRNNSFLTDGSFASIDPTATPYALLKGLSEWWVCHLTKEFISEGSESEGALGDDDAPYVYSDIDDCTLLRFNVEKGYIIQTGVGRLILHPADHLTAQIG